MCSSTLVCQVHFVVKNVCVVIKNAFQVSSFLKYISVSCIFNIYALNILADSFSFAQCFCTLCRLYLIKIVFHFFFGGGVFLCQVQLCFKLICVSKTFVYQGHCVPCSFVNQVHLFVNHTNINCTLHSA